MIIISKKCGKDTFKTLERCQNHSCWPRVEEDEEDEVDEVEEDEEDEDNVLVEEDENFIESICCSGSNEVVKTFNQKCVISCESGSDYAFKHCGHQCVCEQCYRNKGDINILKCVVCRT